MRQIRYVYHVVMDAFYTFLADDGWAIASHIALSTLMALFPFLIVLTSLAGFFGSKELADQAAGLLLQVWPKQVADALSSEVHDVLTTTRGDILTIGAVLAVYFASNGVEALRTALNRAYAVIEPRSWYWLRLESIGYTLVAAITSLAMAFLIVLGPLDSRDGAALHSVLRREQRTIPVLCPLRRHHHGADRGAADPARLAAGGTPRFPADPARHHLHHGGIADLGHRVRPVSGALRQ